VPGELVLAPGVFVLVPGVVLVVLVGVFVLVFGGVLVVVGGVEFVLVPEAAKATAGATEMISGTLQPALSSVLLEMQNDGSRRSPPCERPS
jgi:hypothetical protein